MSIRIAVALAATIGVGVLMSQAAEARPEMVGVRGDYTPGTIVVKTNERRLYLILDSGHAMRYPVGVGRAGKQWAGVTKIDGKYRNPAWSPPSRSQARQAGHAGCDSRRLAAQPDGRRRDDAGRRRIRHPRHQRAGLGRRLRLLRLHPHAERRHHRSVPARFGRHDRDGDALIASIRI